LYLWFHAKFEIEAQNLSFLCQKFWITVLRLPIYQYRRTIDFFGLRRHDGLERSGSSCDVRGRPADFRFSTFVRTWNWLNQHWIALLAGGSALLAGGSLPHVQPNLRCTLTLDFLSANCGTADHIWERIALAHGICAKYANACLKKDQESMNTLQQILAPYQPSQISHYSSNVGPYFGRYGAYYFESLFLPLRRHTQSRFLFSTSVLRKIKLFCRLTIYQSTRRYIPNNLKNSHETSVAVMSRLSLSLSLSLYG
jgi:hypothetical protein